MKALRRVLAALVALATLSTMAVPAPASADDDYQSEFYTGDVNLDGKVDLLDLASLKKMLLGLKPLSQMYISGYRLRPVLSESEAAERNVATIYSGDADLYAGVDPKNKRVTYNLEGGNLNTLNIVYDTTIKEGGEVVSLDYLNSMVYQNDYNYLVYAEYDTDTDDVITLDVVPFNAQTGLVTLYGQFYDMEVDADNGTVSVPALGTTLQLTDDTTLGGVSSLDEISDPSELSITYDVDTKELYHVSYSPLNMKVVLNGTVTAVDGGKATVEFDDGYTCDLDLDASVGDTVRASSFGDAIDEDWFKGARVVVFPQDEPLFYTGDVNLDGKVNLLDLLSLKRMSLGLTYMHKMCIKDDSLKAIVRTPRREQATILATGYTIDRDSDSNTIHVEAIDGRLDEVTLQCTDDTFYRGDFSSFDELADLLVVCETHPVQSDPTLVLTYYTDTNEVVSCEQYVGTTDTVHVTGYDVDIDEKMIFVDAIDSKLYSMRLQCTDDTTYTGRDFSNFDELAKTLVVYETHPCQSDPCLYVTYDTLTREVISCVEHYTSGLSYVSVESRGAKFGEDTLSAYNVTDSSGATVDPMVFTIKDNTDVTVYGEETTFDELAETYKDASGYMELDVAYYYDSRVDGYVASTIEARYIDAVPDVYLSTTLYAKEYTVDTDTQTVEVQCTDGTTVVLECFDYTTYGVDYDSLNDVASALGNYFKMDVTFHAQTDEGHYLVDSLRVSPLDATDDEQYLTVPYGSREYKVEYVDSDSKSIAINSIYTNEYVVLYVDDGTEYSGLVGSFDDLDYYKDCEDSVVLTNGECISTEYRWYFEYHTDEDGKSIVDRVDVATYDATTSSTTD